MDHDLPHAPDPAALSGAVLEIDLAVLAANWRGLRDLARGSECAAVVKADGYGLGLEPVAAALHRAGARSFFVATLAEGRRLRAVLPEAAIHVLNGLPPDAAPLFAAARLRPVLGSRPELEDWAAFNRASGGRHPAAIQVDTGMNRLGLSLAEALALAAETDALPGLQPCLLMSQLACADRPDHPLTRRQLDAFRALSAAFPGIPASLANSAGILAGPDFHFDMVRPGIALYGAEAIEGRLGPVRPVATLQAPVIQVRDVPAGGTIGYGAAFVAQRPMRVAILGVGYADGYLRAAGGTAERSGAEVAIAGGRARVVGRISMDLTAIDVTDLPAVARGSLAELFGPERPIDEVARSAGTIGYELLTRIGGRVTRNYVNGR